MNSRLKLLAVVALLLSQAAYGQSRNTNSTQGNKPGKNQGVVTIPDKDFEEMMRWSRNNGLEERHGTRCVCKVVRG